MKLAPYPDYKDSGVEWLGRVPNQWRVIKIKYLFEERVEKGFLNEPLLLSSQEKGVIPKNQYETRTVIAQKDIHLLKLVKVGDFVISLRSFQGGIEYAHHQGIISPAYTVIRLNNRRLFSFYYRYLAKSIPFINLLKLCVTGIREGQNINYASLKNEKIPIPPLSEQKAIGRYLDYMGRRVRQLLRKKQKLVELLNEQKQAVIQRAVSRGLKPDMPLKDSRVEWLGRVPAHWQIRKLRSQFHQHGSGTTPHGEDYYGGDIPWVITGDLNDGIISTTHKTVKLSATEEISALKVYPSGSLLVAMYGATIGKTGILAMASCTNQACFVLAQPVESSVSFIQMVISSARLTLIMQSYGGGQPNINSEIVKSLKVPIPPLTEQKEIVEYLDKTTTKIGDAIARTKREIELLKEYYARLTADVVSGRRDVRAAAAALPATDPLMADGDFSAVADATPAEDFMSKAAESDADEYQRTRT